MLHYFKIIILSFLLFVGTSITAQNKYAIDLDGNESCFVNNDPDGNLDISGEYTIEAWIYVRSFQNLDRIMDRRTVFALDIINPKGSGDYGINFNERNSSDGVIGEIETNSAEEDLYLNKWYHIAVTFNGDSCKLFVNENLVGLYIDSYWSLSSSTNALNIGGRYWGSYGYQIDAILDEIRISNIARDISEMQTSSHFEEYESDENTILLLHFNDIIGDSLVYETEVGLSGSTGGDDFGEDDYSDDLIDDPDFLLRPKYRSKQSGNWNSQSNWEVESDTNNFIDANSIPTKYSESIEIQNSHIIEIFSSDTASAYDLNIESGGGLEISGELSIENNLTNNASEASLVLKSTVSSQGSLIHHNSGVNATVERYIGGYTAEIKGWHLLSSPVDEMLIEASDFEPEEGFDDLYYWDENDSTLGMWINYYDTGFDRFTNGKGYLCAYDEDDTRDFIGELNVSDVSWENLSADIDHWHLLGNPFPCALDWSKGDWSINNFSMAEIFDVSAYNYFPLNDGVIENQYIIPPTQGFFVQAASATNHITIPTEARVHNSQDWYKNKSSFINDIIIHLTTSELSFYDHTSIRFSDDALIDYELGRDSYKIFGSPEAPQISSIFNKEPYSLNYIPHQDDLTEIPLNLYFPKQAIYEIRAEIKTFEISELYLEDRYSNHLQNLISDPVYQFNANNNEVSNRFILHLKKPTHLNILSEEDVIIYTAKKEIIILSEDNLNGEFELFSLDGKRVFSRAIYGNQKAVINLSELQGIYLARFINNNVVVTKKVLL